MSIKENQKIKDEIKTTFNDVAKNYDTNKQFQISAKKMVQLIDISDKNVNILDLSTGTGSIAIELGKKFPSANIIGVDISEEMLNIARAKTEEEGLKNIVYQLQDVENLKLDDMKFELITCGYGLFFYPDMDRVFLDVCSKLSSNGKFVFSTFNENAFQPYSKIFLDMLEKNYNIKSPTRIEKRQLNTSNEIKELVSQVKHVNLNINDVNIRFPMSIDEWWKLLNSTGYQGLLSQLNENYIKFESEYIESLESMSDGKSIEFNADSFISVVSI